MGALYPDEGSSNIEVHDNVITGMSEKGTCYGAETLFFGRFSAVLQSKSRTFAKTGSGQPQGTLIEQLRSRFCRQALQSDVALPLEEHDQERFLVPKLRREWHRLLGRRCVQCVQCKKAQHSVPTHTPLRAACAFFCVVPQDIRFCHILRLRSAELS